MWDVAVWLEHPMRLEVTRKDLLVNHYTTQDAHEPWVYECVYAYACVCKVCGYVSVCICRRACLCTVCGRACVMHGCTVCGCACVCSMCVCVQWVYAYVCVCVCVYRVCHKTGNSGENFLSIYCCTKPRVHLVNS